MAPPEQDELKAVLLNIEQHHLKGLLEDVEGWNTKYIDYHPPLVERAYRDLDDELRISLHRIHPCKRSEALFHPHPWPGADLARDGSQTWVYLSLVKRLEPNSQYKPSDLFGHRRGCMFPTLQSSILSALSN